MIILPEPHLGRPQNGAAEMAAKERMGIILLVSSERAQS